MKKIIFFIYFLIFGCPAWSLNFSVAPTKFQVDLSKTTNHETYLINNTSKPLRIKVYTEAPKSYEKYNLNENIMIFPKMVSIKPGAKQEVRFRVKPSENMGDGEYRSFLVFREIPSEIKTTNLSQENQSNEAKLTVITETAINVFGERGEVFAKGEIKNFKSVYKNKSFYISADILSEGNTALKINYEIKEKNKKIAEGKFGNSLRTGKNVVRKEISFNISDFNISDFDFENLSIVLYDQNKNTLYEGKLSE